VHPETGGWDLLLIDVKRDLQIGIQSKLRANFELLVQAYGRYNKGPEIHAVLIPAPTLYPDFVFIANALDFVVLDACRLILGTDYGNGYNGQRQSIASAIEGARVWRHDAREWVPPFEVAGIGGGRSAPVQITPWKIAAIKLCRILRARGYLLKNDFAEHRVSPTWWVRPPYPVLRCQRFGKQWRYLISGEAKLPDERWPEMHEAMSNSGIEMELVDQE
jgi:hypothetical protein